MTRFVHACIHVKRKAIRQSMHVMVKVFIKLQVLQDSIMGKYTKGKTAKKRKEYKASGVNVYLERKECKLVTCICRYSGKVIRRKWCS